MWIFTGADFTFGLLDAMVFGFALAFVFAVQMLRAHSGLLIWCGNTG